MKVLSSILFLTIAFSSLSQGVLSPELLWKLRRLSGGTVSPDGSMVLFSERVFDISENKGNTDLFILDVKTSKITQITQTLFSEMEAQWGINNTIWYMSTEKDGLQIWKMKADGTSKQQCSNFKGIELEGFKLAPNESSVITIEAVKMIPTVQDKYPDLPKANARIENDLMYRHWDH